MVDPITKSIIKEGAKEIGKEIGKEGVKGGSEVIKKPIMDVTNPVKNYNEVNTPKLSELLDKFKELASEIENSDYKVLDGDGFLDNLDELFVKVVDVAKDIKENIDIETIKGELSDLGKALEKDLDAAENLLDKINEIKDKIEGMLDYSPEEVDEDDIDFEDGE